MHDWHIKAPAIAPDNTVGLLTVRDWLLIARASRLLANEADIDSPRASPVRGAPMTEFAEAHGLGGNRYFVGTMTFDDPAVADEAIVANFSYLG